MGEEAEELPLLFNGYDAFVNYSVLEESTLDPHEVRKVSDIVICVKSKEKNYTKFVLCFHFLPILLLITV